MPNLRAFVGHSFLEQDEQVVRVMLDYLDDLEGVVPGFTWEHAEAAEPLELAEKVKRKMQDKEIFIGICTVRHMAVPESECKVLPWIGRSWFRSTSGRPTTSEWILQEIGMAVGRDMELILLVEEPIGKLVGLQGDIEFVPFDRSNPTKTFPRILQMIRSISPGGTVAAATVAPAQGEDDTGSTPESANDQAPASEAVAQDPDPTWSATKFELQLFRAIVEDDVEREERIVDVFQTSVLADDPEWSLRFRSERLFWQHRFKGVRIVSDLQSLCETDPSHAAHGRFLLSLVYREYGDFQSAAQQNMLSADASMDSAMKVTAWLRAAANFYKAQDDKNAEMAIGRASTLAGTDESCRVKYYSGRARLSKDIDREYEFFAFAEKALQCSPEDEELRFDLAYEVSEADIDSLAYYHYRILANGNAGNAQPAWNNLGTAAAALSLAGKAVTAYEKSGELGGSRAWGNLAFQYAAGGFFEDAQRAYEKGSELDLSDERVANAVSHLQKLKDQEEDRQKSVLEEARTIQHFFRNLGSSLDRLVPNDLNGSRWVRGATELTVSIDDGRLRAEGTRKTLAGLLGAFRDVRDDEVIRVMYDGVLHGSTVRAKLTEVDETSSRDKPEPRDVILVIHPNEIIEFECQAPRKELVTWKRRLDKED